MNEREFRTLLRRITDELRALRQEIATITEQQAAKAPQAQEPVRPLPLEVQTDAITQHAIREHYEAENRERNSWFARNKRQVETIGVAVAVLLAIFNLLTLSEIHKQTPAVISGAETARVALTSVQRAFLSFQEPIISGHAIGATNPTSSFQFPVRNDGDTPARSVQQHMNVTSLSTNLPSDFPFKDFGARENARFFVGPRQSVTARVALEVPSAILERVKRHEITLLFWGWAHYNDVFPLTPAHITMFCGQLVNIEGDLKLRGARIGARIEACNRHNCSDDECDGEPYGDGQVWHTPQK